MHGHDAVHGKPVVHEGEDTLLILAPVPGAEDHGDLLLDVEGNGDLGVKVVLLPLLVGLGACVDDGKVYVPGDLVVRGGTDEHVGDEMLLPCHLVNEPDLPPGVLASSAVDVGDVELCGEVRSEATSSRLLVIAQCSIML